MIVTVAGCGEQSTGPVDRASVFNPARFQPHALLSADGRPVDLWQQVGEAPATVIVFTRSDCPISNRYAPAVNKLFAAYHPRGVAFRLIYVDPKESDESIGRHVEEFAYSCPVLRDPTHALVAATGAKVTPEAVVFDSQRRMVYRGRIDDLFADLGQSRDAATTHELADAIDAALARRPVAQPITDAVGCPIGDLR